MRCNIDIRSFVRRYSTTHCPGDTNFIWFLLYSTHLTVKATLIFAGNAMKIFNWSPQPKTLKCWERARGRHIIAKKKIFDWIGRLVVVGGGSGITNAPYGINCSVNKLAACVVDVEFTESSQGLTCITNRPKSQLSRLLFVQQLHHTLTVVVQSALCGHTPPSHRVGCLPAELVLKQYQPSKPSSPLEHTIMGHAVTEKANKCTQSAPPPPKPIPLQALSKHTLQILQLASPLEHTIMGHTVT